MQGIVPKSANLGSKKPDCGQLKVLAGDWVMQTRQCREMKPGPHQPRGSGSSLLGPAARDVDFQHLTRNADIKLNKRVLLRPIWDGLACPASRADEYLIGRAIRGSLRALEAALPEVPATAAEIAVVPCRL
jgi:hypothetical protein